MARAALRRAERAPYVDALGRAADAAAAVAGGYEDRCYEINGYSVRLRFAGPPEIRQLADALSHLSAPCTADSSLTVRIWDSRSSGLPEPEGPWTTKADLRRTVRGLLPPELGFFLRYDQSLAVLDMACQEAYYWFDDATSDRCADRAAPLSPILGGWLAEHGMHLVHAGAVGSKHGSVVLAGIGGSGKSHAVLSSLQAGLAFIGDDTCLLDSQDPPTTHSIYNSAQALPFTLRCLPALGPMVSNPERGDDEKALLFMAQHMPESLLRAAPLRAIALVSFGDHKDTFTHPASPGDALATLAPSSLMQQPGAGQPMLTRLAKIARSVECVQLNAGTDPAMLARAIRGLL